MARSTEPSHAAAVRAASAIDKRLNDIIQGSCVQNVTWADLITDEYTPLVKACQQEHGGKHHERLIRCAHCSNAFYQDAEEAPDATN